MDRYRRVASCLAVLTAAGAVQVHAQDGSSHDQAATAIDDIVVTASRREERLQSVPVAITALGEEALEKLQVTNVAALARAAPSLNILKVQGDPSGALFFMRGLGSTDSIASIDPAVGVYLDGIYIARAPGANMDMVDVARVEVLRGPQGTLFGRNTIGGAINIVPNTPSEDFKGSVSVEAGSFDQRRIVGIANIPLDSNVAFRVAASHSQQDGFAKSSFSGRDLGGGNSDFVRAQLRWQIGGDWTVLASGDYTDNSFFGQWVTAVSLTGGQSASVATPAQLAPYSDRYRRITSPSVAGPFHGKVKGAGLQITGDIAFATFKSITAVRSTAKVYRDLDTDGTPYNIVGAARGFSDQKQFSQEFQIFGDTATGRLKWIAGVFYFDESGEDFTAGRSNLPQNPAPNATSAVTNASVINKSLGGYVQGDFMLTQRLRATAGIRYTQDSRSGIHRNSRNLLSNVDTVIGCAIPGAALPDCRTVLPKAKFNFVPFVVGLDYKPTEEVLLYGKFSRGFRAGGYTMRVNQLDVLRRPFEPEKVNVAELGFKSDLLDRRLRINLAAYRALYRNIQLNVNVADPTGNQPAGVGTILNAGTATIKGMEAEGILALGPIVLSGSFGYTDARYTSIAPTAAVTGISTRSNFSFVPKYTALAAAEYTVTTRAGEVSLTADYNYKSKVYFGPIPPSDPNAFERGYGLANIAASFHFSALRLTVTGFVRNLANRRYINRGLVAAPLLVAGFPGDPRTAGARIRYEF